MKRIIPIFLILFLLFHCSDNQSSEDVKPTITLSPENVTTNIGDETTISVNINDLDISYFALSLRINYDPEFISFNNFNEGEVFSNDAVSFVKNTGAEIHISLSLIQGTNEINKTGKFCSISFKSEAVGSSTIVLQKEGITFYDSSGNTITVDNLNIVNSSITVE